MKALCVNVMSLLRLIGLLRLMFPALAISTSSAKRVFCAGRLFTDRHCSFAGTSRFNRDALLKSDPIIIGLRPTSRGHRTAYSKRLFPRVFHNFCLIDVANCPLGGSRQRGTVSLRGCCTHQAGNPSYVT